MEHAYSILMAIFAAAILVYAALMAITKDYNMLPYRATNSVKPKDPKRYMTQLAKAVALAALSPALSALTGLWSVGAALAVFVLTLALFLWLATKIMKGVE